MLMTQTSTLQFLVIHVQGPGQHYRSGTCVPANKRTSLMLPKAFKLPEVEPPKALVQMIVQKAIQMHKTHVRR